MRDLLALVLAFLTVVGLVVWALTSPPDRPPPTPFAVDATELAGWRARAAQAERQRDECGASLVQARERLRVCELTGCDGRSAHDRR